MLYLHKGVVWEYTCQSWETSHDFHFSVDFSPDITICIQNSELNGDSKVFNRFKAYSNTWTTNTDKQHNIAINWNGFHCGIAQNCQLRILMNVSHVLFRKASCPKLRPALLSRTLECGSSYWDLKTGTTTNLYVDLGSIATEVGSAWKIISSAGNSGDGPCVSETFMLCFNRSQLEKSDNHVFQTVTVSSCFGSLVDFDLGSSTLLAFSISFSEAANRYSNESSFIYIYAYYFCDYVHYLVQSGLCGELCLVWWDVWRWKLH